MRRSLSLIGMKLAYHSQSYSHREALLSSALALEGMAGLEFGA